MERGTLVSTVIPTRNRPELVCRAVESVLAQTHPNMEAIVVIDGPDDHTRSALSAINDPRLRVIALEQNAGGSEARNIGVRAAHGQWIALLDDDDIWFPEKIEAQLAKAQILEVRYPILCSRVIARGPDGDAVIPKVLYKEPQPAGDYLFCREGLSNSSGFIQTSSILVPKALIEAVPFRKGLKRHQDWDWLLRVSQHPGVGIVMLPEALSVFDMGGRRTSISRVPDWGFSAEWAHEVRPLLTGRAYSHFIGIFCVTSAAAAGAGISAQLHLLRQMLAEGSFSAGALARFALYALAPHRLRSALRGRSPQARSAPASSKTEPV